MGSMNEKIMLALEDLPKIKGEIAGIKGNLSEMNVRIDILWRLQFPESSPSVKLNDNEIKILKKSGIDNFAKRHYPEVLAEVKALDPDNPVQAEQLLISVMNRYKKDDDSKAILREASLSSGYDVDSLLLIAALSMRNRIISDLGF